MIIDRKNQFNLERGRRPASYSEYRALHAKTVINLESGVYDLFQHKRNEELAWAEALDIQVIHLPCSFIYAPTPSDVRLFLAFVHFGLDKGNVYFHCKDGVDRTGWMAMAYRIKVQFWPHEKALSEMLKMGFHRYRYFYWLRV